MTLHMEKIRFANFELNIPARQLSRDDQPIKIGSRAFDILSTLAARPGELIGKADLIATVWPDTIVSEGVLRVHMVALRKALGATATCPFVRAIPGRGYAFVAETETQPSPLAHDAADLKSVPILHGRDDTLADLEVLSGHGLISLVGPGGVGKTVVAQAFARRYSAAGADAVMIDLAEPDDTHHVAERVHAVLEQHPLTRGSRLLLVLDNCEQVIDQVARLAETMLAENPPTTLLVTSREPLRIAGEIVLRLRPLPLPGRSANAEEIAASPAVQLFLNRAGCSLPNRPTPGSSCLRQVTEIVRSLDGLPLALELAAGRAAELGLDDLLQRIERPLAILRHGRRTAPAYQQSMRASLQRSFARLTADEHALLSAISSLPETFSLADMRRAAPTLGEDHFEEAVRGLVSKSVIERSACGESYHLLALTRDYVRELHPPEGSPLKDVAGRSQVGNRPVKHPSAMQYLGLPISRSAAPTYRPGGLSLPDKPLSTLSPAQGGDNVTRAPPKPQ